VALLIFLAPLAGLVLLNLNPASAIQIHGVLADAVIVDITKQGTAEEIQEGSAKAKVGFDAKCKSETGGQCREIATIILPAGASADAVQGSHIPITYLPEKPGYAEYGLVRNTLFDPDAMAGLVTAAALAAL